MKEQWNKDKLNFIEEMARSCEEAFGLPRMGGRIWAVLLITDKDQLSAEELMHLVHASRGSVSTMVRMLENIGLVKRVKLRGDRKHYYSSMESDALIHAELNSIKMFVRLMEHGSRILTREDRRAKQRLDEIRTLMEFFITEYKTLLERWHKQKAKQ